MVLNLMILYLSNLRWDQILKQPVVSDRSTGSGRRIAVSPLRRRHVEEIQRLRRGRQVGVEEGKVQDVVELHRRNTEVVRHRRGRVHQVSATRHGGAGVGVLPLVGGDDDGRVLGRSLHPLLHAAHGGCAPVVAPAK